MKHFTLFFDRCRRAAAFALLVCLISLTGCHRDPHAGMAEVHNGNALVWVYPWKGAEVNTLAAADFYTPDDGKLVNYTGDAVIAQQGVDVSYFQGEIDWEAVKADGVDFAMIRAGYRGYRAECAGRAGRGARDRALLLLAGDDGKRGRGGGALAAGGRKEI